MTQNVVNYSVHREDLGKTVRRPFAYQPDVSRDVRI